MGQNATFFGENLKKINKFWQILKKLKISLATKTKKSIIVFCQENFKRTYYGKRYSTYRKNKNA